MIIQLLAICCRRRVELNKIKLKFIINIYSLCGIKDQNSFNQYLIETFFVILLENYLILIFLNFFISFCTTHFKQNSNADKNDL